jgi:hypothetical protein
MFRKVTAIAAMLATAVAVAACGGSSSPNSRNASSKTAGKNKDVALKLAECMRSHGVPDFPDPQGGGSGFGIQANAGPSGGSVSVDGHTLNVSAPAFQQAMQACQKDQPQGPPISGAQLAQAKQGAIKMAECMRSHGVPNFPDPRVTVGPGGHGIAMQIGGGPGTSSGINPRSPAFQSAQKVCMPLMGARAGSRKVLG